MKKELLSRCMQRRVRLLRWIVICVTGLALLAVVGNPQIILRPSEPVSLPEYLEPKEYVEGAINYKEDHSTNDDSYTTVPIKAMKDIENELESRRMRLENLCETIEDELSSIQTAVSKMIIDTKHAISWCPVYKAGSSLWMEHFAVLGGILSDTTADLIRRDLLQVNTIVRQVFPKDLDLNETLEKMKETKKFLVVRHPFERLLSAYRDKLEHMEGREYYYRRFGRHIMYRYREKKNSTETKLEPTFVEFLKFIAEERYFDEHWAPYSHTCRPCAIHYDYILKFETFKRDQEFLIRKLGLDEYLQPNNNVKNVNRHGPTTDTVVRKYFKVVPKWLLKKVHEIYEKDFKLFNYSPANYFFMSSK